MNIKVAKLKDVVGYVADKQVHGLDGNTHI
jgi:CO dehydrogenase/acetyl-CoA synthase epsilon subunit